MTETIFRLDPDPDGMTPSDFTEPEAFTTDDRSEFNRSTFTNEDDTVLCGVWECAPCREEIESYPVHEMMTVISGSVTLTHPDGRAETFTDGDTFFVAKGSRLIWEITRKLRKYYMIVV